MQKDNTIELNNVYSEVEKSLMSLRICGGENCEFNNKLKTCVNKYKDDDYVLFKFAKLCVNLGKISIARNIFERCVELNINNKHAKLELGKLYVRQGKIEDGERLFKECIELDSRGIYPRVELLRICILNRDIDKAEEYINECLLIDNGNQCVQRYSDRITILKDYDLFNIYNHIRKHEYNDLTKELHGVFHGDSIAAVNRAFRKRKCIKPIQDVETFRYNVPCNNAGYEGGNKGSRKRLDYITLIVINDKLISAYPSDGLEKN